MEEEVWKDIPDYESLYSASNLGRVFSKKSNKILSTKVSKGYSRLTLYQNKIKKGFLTHRLIMITFYGDSELQVDHINGIKIDNRLSNLRYVQPRENIKFHFEKATQRQIGIRICSDGKYSVRIWIENRRYDLGRFFTETEASNDYNKALDNYNTNSTKPLEKKFFSDYKGVRQARNRFHAKLSISKVQYNLGSYDIEQEASDAYQKALYDWENFKTLPNYINPNKASKYEGIYYVKNSNKPWKASIKITDNREYIGYYYTEEEAREAQLKHLEPNS